MFYTKGLEYLIPFIISVAAIFCFVFFCVRKLKNADEHKKLLPVRIVFFVLICLEVIKIFLIIREEGALKAIRFPIVFCSLAMYAYPLFAFKKNRLSSFGKTFAILPSIIAGLMFFILPGDLFVYSPIYVFTTCHSFFYHGAIIAVALYMIISGTYKFKFNDHFFVSAGLSIYLGFCFVLSIFMQKGVSLFGPNSGFLAWLFDSTGYAPGILAIMMSFCILSYIVYKIIDIVQKQKSKSLPQ